MLLGTLNVILLVEEPGGPSGEQLDRLAARAFTLMSGLEEELSKFEPESEVSLLNYLGAERSVTVAPELFSLLSLSRDYWRKTRGAFDPALAGLSAAWGFDDGCGRVPSDREIALLLEAGGMDGVILDEKSQSVSFSRPGVAVDLGGIAKGFIVDRAVASLREGGARAGAFLSGRSTLVFWGQAPDEEHWRVGVADPRDPDRMRLELQVREGVVSSSSASERRFEVEGREYGHVLDPRTGRPVSHRGLGVTVWTPDALVGDVASTSLFVLGRDEGEEILDAFSPISVVFLEEDSLTTGGVTHTIHTRGDPGFVVVD